MIVKVEISEIENRWASYAGILREEEAKCMGRPNNHSRLHKYVDDHVIGAIGEYVASLALGVPWRGPGKFQGEDLVGGFEVRTTDKLNGSLILRSKDPDDAVFILVIGGPLKWFVPGWILGKDGKQKEFWDNPCDRPGAYFVPQLALKPIKDLRR